MSTIARLGRPELTAVNANRRHYEQAAHALAKADPDWLESLITRRVPIDRWQEAFARGPNDVKVLLEIGK